MQRSGGTDGAASGGRLLGRDEEIPAVIRALAASRLVTLTGAPGIGKTRLALAVAGSHRDRPVVVELAPVADPGLASVALASALSVQEVPGQSLIDTIVATSRGRRLLVLIDNCEHLLGACRHLVERLLEGCQHVTVLATSREPLGLEGEQIWQVPPLSVPAPEEVGTEAVLAYPAVTLFVQRASEAQPGFVFNGALAADVAEICRRLDGVPLAIELAAARVEMFTPAEIARRLEDRLSLLSDDHQGRLPRHQTLQAALDWSHALLSARERVLLRRLSVFAGRFELESAEAVCASGEVASSETPELVVGLVSKSLLDTDPDSDSDEPSRYRLLETIRTYAGEKLQQAGEAPDLRTAHAHFYLALAERAEPELTGPRQEPWLERLEAERANLRAAVEWSLSHGQTELALRLAGALVLFWRARCHFSDGRDLLDAVLAASDGEALALIAKARWGAGFLTFMAGDPRGATSSLEQSLADFRELGDRPGCARALLILANAKQLDNHPSVLAMLDESAQLAREAGDRWCLAHALGVAGFECIRNGDLRRARELLEECLDVARDTGDKQSLCPGLLGLGQVALCQGDYREAQSLLDEAVEVTAALGEDFGRATALKFLGDLALGRGEYGRARELLDEGLAVIPEPVPPGARAESLVLLATVAHAQGDRPRARRLLDEVLACGARGPSVMQLLALLALEDGDPGEARRLFEEMRRLAQAGGWKRHTARALHGLARLARSGGDLAHAGALLDEALELNREVGELPAIVGLLEAVAGVAAEGGHHRYAARLFGAANALRERGGYARAPWVAARYEADMALCRSLPAEALASALAAGSALSLAQALAEASKGPRRTRAATGWSSLTKRERQVVELVSEGLTNIEIAERLVISLETVKTHLSRCFSKLGVSRRSGLARQIRSGNGAPR